MGGLLGGGGGGWGVQRVRWPHSPKLLAGDGGGGLPSSYAYDLKFHAKYGTYKKS